MGLIMEVEREMFVGLIQRIHVDKKKHKEIVRKNRKQRKDVKHVESGHEEGSDIHEQLFLSLNSKNFSFARIWLKQSVFHYFDSLRQMSFDI